MKSIFELLYKSYFVIVLSHSEILAHTLSHSFGCMWCGIMFARDHESLLHELRS